MSLLTLENLSVSFASAQGEVQAVKNVSLTLERGEMLALVGESGSGKSLTALSCLKLLPPSAQMTGEIKFEGEEVLTMRSSRLKQLRGQDVGIIFQEPMTALNPLHTIGRQIVEMLTLHQRMEGKALRARMEELLAQVGLPHFKDRLDAYPHQLSGGERQRVMIAMAIANNPKLLIADEPTTAVDVTVQVKILALLKRLQKELGMAMLFITHDLTLVKRLSDRVAVMKAGEIVEQGKVAEVFFAPQHEYTKALLASEPKGLAVMLPPSPMTVLQGDKVGVRFPIKKGVFRRVVGYNTAVEEANITLSEGETLGVVGESGSGKTTLALALLRLVKSEGTIVFLGDRLDMKSIHEMRPLREQMQLVFQDPYGSLNPRMTVREIVEEGLKVHKPEMDAAARAAKVEKILQEVGLLPAMAERYPHEFSGGQRQRIAIARAMVLAPKFVVLDEPTSALDLTIQAQLLALLKRFQEKEKVSYLFISHDLRVVRSIAHRIIVLKKGRIVEEGVTASLFDAPKEAYTRELIDAAFLKSS